MITEIQSVEQFKQFISQPQSVVEFFAPWCPHCQKMQPQIEAFASSSSIPVAQVNVDNFQNLCQEYGVEEWPYLFCFANGEVVNKSIGERPEAEIAQFVQESFI